MPPFALYRDSAFAKVLKCSGANALEIKSEEC